MWTKNGKFWLSRQIGIRLDIEAYKATDGTISGFPNSSNYISGTISANNYPSDIANPPTPSAALYKYYLYVGSGDTEPSEDDYTLVAPVSLKMTSATITTLAGSTQTIINYILQNNTENIQNIKEIGLFTNGSKGLMLNRRLLASPVIMAVGDVYNFQFTIDTSNLTE